MYLWHFALKDKSREEDYIHNTCHFYDQLLQLYSSNGVNLNQHQIFLEVWSMETAIQLEVYSLMCIHKLPPSCTFVTRRRVSWTFSHLSQTSEQDHINQGVNQTDLLHMADQVRTEQRQVARFQLSPLWQPLSSHIHCHLSLPSLVNNTIRTFFKSVHSLGWVKTAGF